LGWTQNAFAHDELHLGEPDAGFDRVEKSRDRRGKQLDGSEILLARPVNRMAHAVNPMEHRVRARAQRRHRLAHSRNPHSHTQGDKMDRIGRSTLDSFQRVKEFLSQHPLSDEPQTLGVQAAELDDVIQRLSSEAVEQESRTRYTRVHTEYERTLRTTLYADHIQPISQIARDVFGVSGMDKAFRLPRSTKVNQPLIAAASAMAEAAEKEKDVFLRHGLGQDFIERLKAAALALEETRTAKNESRRRRTTATAMVRHQVSRGRKAVRLLNAVLLPRLKKDPQLLAAWKSARRVRPTTAPVVAVEGDAALKVA